MALVGRLARWGRRTNAPKVGRLLGDLPRFLRDPGRALGVDWATRRLLLFVVLPVWMGAGVTDWVHHRRTKIEQTSGTHESLIHALMMTEAGIPVLAGLFFEINAGLLALMMGASLAHQATAIWDVAYAETERQVTPNEQHTHSFLEVVPFAAVALAACLHWDQLLALAGQGPTKPDFRLRLKRPRLANGYIAGILAAVGGLVIAPYAEEFWRCYRLDHSLRAKDLPDQQNPLAALRTYAGVIAQEEQPSE
jgi:hypothetical protein